MFFIIEHGSRQVVHVGMTRQPTDEWVARQVRAATLFEAEPRYLICDNDRKFGLRFERAVQGAGIALIRTPVAAPKANAICERFLGSVRRECLDQVIILSEKHLRWVIREYVTFFNQARPHQGINQRIPTPRTTGVPSAKTAGQRVTSIPILGGLHHDYQWAA